MYTLSGVHYPSAHFFSVIYINIIGALKEHQNNNDLNMMIMTMKSK